MNPSFVFHTVRAEASRFGYTFWPSPGPTARKFDLFVFGIRGSAIGTNLFDDAVGVAYIDEAGLPVGELFRATTDPGRASLDHPQNVHGTATVIPGQYRRVWTDGMHHGKYRCLTQKPDAVIPVWRGTDRSREWSDAAGIQLHHAFGASRVDWYSAGCQVFQVEASLSRMLWLYDQQVSHGHGKDISYTLFDAKSSPVLGALLPVAA